MAEAAQEQPNEIELSNPPSDGISSLTYSAGGLLGVGSWDSKARVYDIDKNELLKSWQCKGAVLCVKFPTANGLALHPTLSPNAFVSGSLDCSVRLHDLESSEDRILGTHDKAVKTIEFMEESGLVVSGSWDKTLKVWDLRSPWSTQTVNLPGEVYTTDTSGYNLIVGTAGRAVEVYDMRSMNEPAQRRESSLKHQTRVLRCFTNGEGFAIGSSEGRIAMEYLDPDPAIQKKKYAFKCHRQKLDGVDHVFPVNALAFHPSFGTFASGGCDGIVNVWDGFNRKRIYQYRKFPTSIAALEFSPPGDRLAIAVSYTFEEGEKDHPADTIVIRRIQEQEVRPKARTSDK